MAEIETPRKHKSKEKTNSRSGKEKKRKLADPNNSSPIATSLISPSQAQVHKKLRRDVVVAHPNAEEEEVVEEGTHVDTGTNGSLLSNGGPTTTAIALPLGTVDSSSPQPFEQITTALYVPLSPIYHPTPWHSIETDHLDPLILTYYPPLHGIILAYKNLRFKQSAARIMYDSPFAYIWITVDFLVWKPHKGGVLEGWVNLQSASHIGLLVLNTFNASIPRERIPGDWVYEERRVGFERKKVKTTTRGQMEQERGDDTTAVVGTDGDVDMNGDGRGGEVVAEEGQEEGEEEAAEEEDTGGWKDSSGTYIDGLLQFNVESVRASGHIIAIEGSLLNTASPPLNTTNNHTNTHTNNTSVSGAKITTAPPASAPRNSTPGLVSTSSSITEPPPPSLPTNTPTKPPKKHKDKSSSKAKESNSTPYTKEKKKKHHHKEPIEEEE